MDLGRVREMTSDTFHQIPAGTSNHAQADSPLNSGGEAGGALQVLVAVTDTRPLSCVADQCQTTRLAPVHPLYAISLSHVPGTWLPGWIPEALEFPGRRKVFSTL